MTLHTHRKKPPFPIIPRALLGGPDGPPWAEFPPCQWLMLYDHADAELRVVNEFDHEVMYRTPSAYVRATREFAGGTSDNATVAILSGLGENVVVSVVNERLETAWSWTDEVTQPHEHGDIAVDEDGAVYFAIASADTVTVRKVADAALVWSKVLSVPGVPLDVAPPVAFGAGVVWVAALDEVFVLSADDGAEVDTVTWPDAVARVGSFLTGAFVLVALVGGETHAQRFTYGAPGGVMASGITGAGAVTLHDEPEEPWFSTTDGGILYYGGAADGVGFLSRVYPGRTAGAFLVDLQPPDPELRWRLVTEYEGGDEGITSLTPTVYGGFGYDRVVFLGRSASAGEARLLRRAGTSGSQFDDNGPLREPPVSRAIRMFNCGTPAFYWHAIDQDFRTASVRADGSVVWDTDGSDGYLGAEFWSLYGWPGWPHLTSTREGAFHPVTVTWPGEAAFFLVTPDGEPGGKALSVPATNGWAWGVEAAADKRGDHFAIYGGTSGDDAVVAAWNGISTMKWARSYDSLVTDGVIVTASSPKPASLAVSPDGKVAVVLFSDDTLAGFSTEDGSTLWFSRSLWGTAATNRWEGNQRVRFARSGRHAFVQTMDRETTASPYEGAVHRLDWTPNYGTEPAVTWTHAFSAAGGYSPVTGIAPLADGGVLAQGWPVELAEGHPMLRRLDADGAIVWEKSLDEPGSYVARPDDDGYGVIFADSTYAYISYRDEDMVPEASLRRVNLQTGEFDEEGTLFPIEFDMMHIGLAPYVAP